MNGSCYGSSESPVRRKYGMIRFSQYIAELFDAGVPYTQTSTAPSFKKYTFEVDGKSFRVTLIHTHRDVFDIVEIDFSQLYYGLYRASLLNNMGHKGSMQVFATVATIVREALKEYPRKPAISFFAEGKSRIKLYRSLAHRICRSLNYRMNIDTIAGINAGHETVAFVLEPK